MLIYISDKKDNSPHEIRTCDEFNEKLELTMSYRRICFHNSRTILFPHITRKSMFHPRTVQSLGLRIIRPMLNMWCATWNGAMSMSPVNIYKGISAFVNSKLIDSSFRILMEIHGVWRIGKSRKRPILLILAFENFYTGHFLDFAPFVFLLSFISSSFREFPPAPISSHNP